MLFFNKEKNKNMYIPGGVAAAYSPSYNARLEAKIAKLEEEVIRLEYLNLKNVSKRQFELLMAHLNLEFFTEPARSGIREKK